MKSLKVYAVVAFSLALAACTKEKTTSPVKDAPKAEAPAKAEVKAEAKPATAEDILVKLADVQWKPASPDRPERLVARIAGTKEQGMMMLSKAPAGFEMPLHSHSATVTAVVVSGSLKHGRSAADATELSAGSTWVQPAGEVHYASCTTDCLIAAYFDGPAGAAMAEKAHEGDMKTVYTIGDAIPFKPLNPKAPQGPQMHVLSGDMKTGPFRAIAKIPGGLKLPVHTHPASYAAVTLSGQWQKTGKGDMTAGDFWTTAGTVEHQNACLSEEPCVFFIAMDGAFGMTPVEAQN